MRWLEAQPPSIVVRSPLCLLRYFEALPVTPALSLLLFRRVSPARVLSASFFACDTAPSCQCFCAGGPESRRVLLLQQPLWWGEARLVAAVWLLCPLASRASCSYDSRCRSVADSRFACVSDFPLGISGFTTSWKSLTCRAQLRLPAIHRLGRPQQVPPALCYRELPGFLSLWRLAGMGGPDGVPRRYFICLLDASVSSSPADFVT